MDSDFLRLARRVKDMEGAADGYLKVSGGTVTGELTVNESADRASFSLNAGGSKEKRIQMLTDGVRRWIISANSQNLPETGGNAGTPLEFYRYDDAGNYVGTSLGISRANGIVGMPEQPYVYLNNGMANSVSSGSLIKMTCFTYKFSDNKNCWNTSTQRFTAPMGGRYIFIVGGRWDTSLTGNNRYAYHFMVNGHVTNYVGGGVVASGDTPSSTGVFILDLDEGDYVEVFVYTAVALSISYYADMGYSNLGLFLQAMYLG